MSNVYIAHIYFVSLCGISIESYNFFVLFLEWNSFVDSMSTFPDFLAELSCSKTLQTESLQRDCQYQCKIKLLLKATSSDELAKQSWEMQEVEIWNSFPPSADSLTHS